MYDISISIVTYNNENIIKSTLESITSYMDKGLKYIIYVVDNDSKDKTVDQVKSAKGNIVLINSKDNVGFGAGHNLVLNDIDSKYHVVVNPDITINNNCFHVMYEFMEKNQDIGLLSPLIKYPNGKVQYLCKRNPTFVDLLIRWLHPNLFKKRQVYYTMMETNYDKIFDVEYASGCFMFFRTEIFKKIKGFDENIFMYLEDADVTRRVNQVAKTVFYPYTHVIHEWQRGSHKNLKLILINIQSAIYYFKKWGFKLY